MIVKTHALPVKRQAELLEISRTNVYYLPMATSEKDLALRKTVNGKRATRRRKMMG